MGKGERAFEQEVRWPAIAGIPLIGIAFCWQAATRRESNRLYWLIALALTIALAINVHYFGVLLMVPLAFASYYEPDQDLRSRMVLVYSKDQELRWLDTLSMSLTEIHMRNFTPFEIEPYESVENKPGESIFVVSHEPEWEWLDDSFTDAHARVRRVGSAFGVDVVSVRFR